MLLQHRDRKVGMSFMLMTDEWCEAVTKIPRDGHPVVPCGGWYRLHPAEGFLNFPKFINGTLVRYLQFGQRGDLDKEVEMI